MKSWKFSKIFLGILLVIMCATTDASMRNAAPQAPLVVAQEEAEEDCVKLPYFPDEDEEQVIMLALSLCTKKIYLAAR
jgi:hypothetical protein